MKYYLLLLLLSPIEFAYSCSCANEFPKKKEYIEGCESIFVARLINAKYVEAKGDPVYATFSHVEGQLSKDRVVYKGDPSQIVGLKTSMLGTSCEGHLSVGEEYLVCGGAEEYVHVAQCGRTNPVRWGEGKFAFDLFKEEHE